MVDGWLCNLNGVKVFGRGEIEEEDDKGCWTGDEDGMKE